SARFDGEKLRERLRGAHVSDVAVSLADAVQRVCKMTAAITDAMLRAPTPPNEEERLAELNGLNLQDTPREADFDQVTARLTRLFKVPMALLTLVDRIGSGSNLRPDCRPILLRLGPLRATFPFVVTLLPMMKY